MSQKEEKTLAELYDWLDTIPFSRTKKNLARDFSDGVLAAELIKHFIPSIVDLHNYPPTNTLEQKKINWTTLSRKVLKKLDFPLSEGTRSELAGAKRDAIEYFLSNLREKINAFSPRSSHHPKLKKPERLLENLKIEDTIVDCPATPDSPVLSRRSVGGVESVEKKRWLSQPAISSTVPRQIYEQRVHELLLEKQETIMNLKARIRDLEYLLLHKDHIINDLRIQLKETLQPKDCKKRGDVESRLKRSSSNT